MPEFELELDRVATGGTAIGPGPDGRLVFASGGLPGERVVARETTAHKSRIEADVVDVVRPSPLRRSVPCPEVAAGCGGCDWQHVTDDGQRELRRAIVIDCLTRLGGVVEPDVRLGPALDPNGYRTSVRAAVVDGRAGFRAARSHDVVNVGSCLVAHPLVEELLVDGTFGAAEEVSIRVGAATGERLVVAGPTAEGVKVPDDVIVVGADQLAAGHPAHYHEEVGGHRLRISARSFFQCRPDGAALLASLVGEALAPGPVPGPLLDAYGGVGLFGVLLAERHGADGVVVVESNRSSVADAEVNLAAAGVSGGRTLRCRMERWRPEPMGAVIADPARAGLGKESASRLASTGAAVIALVSCDPGSLARDAKLLAGHGYDLDRVTVVDLFGQTSHVETVSRFVGPVR